MLVFSNNGLCWLLLIFCIEYTQLVFVYVSIFVLIVAMYYVLLFFGIIVSWLSVGFKIIPAVVCWFLPPLFVGLFQRWRKSFNMLDIWENVACINNLSKLQQKIEKKIWIYLCSSSIRLVVLWKNIYQNTSKSLQF